VAVGAVLAAPIVLLAACGGSKSTSSSGARTAGTSPTAATAPATTSSTPSSPSSSEASPGVVSGSAGSVAATMHAAGHRPRVGKPWPVSFIATDAGKPAHAEVSYEYLFGGQVVAHRSHYQFTGHFKDIFNWPSSAVGFPLTFRAVIKSTGATLNLDYPVQVIG
jgi:hypothetical protein